MNTRKLKSWKSSEKRRPLSMLTCYDFQTAQLLNKTTLDMILVGDSLGNVVLGHDHTTSVSVEEMCIFGAAVKRGAKDIFTIIDMPFGSYATLEQGVQNAIHIFQKTNAEALKLEGAYPYQLELIKRLTEIGIPVMGHIGLTPQSVHQLGGYYTHGKDESSASLLLESALSVEKAGAFSIVFECIEPLLSLQLTKKLNIPTIGIGCGENTDGQVLVINDLLHFGETPPPKFCTPIADLYTLRSQLINKYLLSLNDSYEISTDN